MWQELVGAQEICEFLTHCNSSHNYSSWVVLIIQSRQNQTNWTFNPHHHLLLIFPLSISHKDTVLQKSNSSVALISLQPKIKICVFLCGDMKKILFFLSHSKRFFVIFFTAAREINIRLRSSCLRIPRFPSSPGSFCNIGTHCGEICQKKCHERFRLKRPHFWIFSQ